MTDQNIQQILEDVAAGRLDPAEASRLIDAAGPKAADGSASTAGPAFTGKPAPPAVPDIERILVRATSRRGPCISSAGPSGAPRRFDARGHR